MQFDNSYARLPERFHTHLRPTPVSVPSLIRINESLATELGIDPAWLASLEGIAMMAGNQLPKGTEPIATVYAGHQFGHFNPQLGDGRAILLGEVLNDQNERFDLQLKGSGPTPYSRQGDGRAPPRPGTSSASPCHHLITPPPLFSSDPQQCKSVNDKKKRSSHR